MAKTPKTTTAATGSIPPFGLRMLPDLKERIENSARSAGRSMNAEIVARLDDSFEKHKGDAAVARAQLDYTQTGAELAVAEQNIIWMAVQMKFLLDLLHCPDPIGAREAFAAEIDKCRQTLAEAQKIADRPGPEDRLEAYRKTIEETRKLVQQWEGRSHSDWEENKVILKAEMRPAPPTSYGPVASRNARKRQT